MEIDGSRVYHPGVYVGRHWSDQRTAWGLEGSGYQRVKDRGTMKQKADHEQLLGEFQI